MCLKVLFHLFHFVFKVQMQDARDITFYASFIVGGLGCDTKLNTML